MPLVEYLYVDKRRLDMYFEQISSPVVYDKVPVWKASLSITGPNTEQQQARFARAPTVHEKIQALSEYLHKEDLLLQGELQTVFEKTQWHIDSLDPNAKVFHSISCQATRVFIPPRPEVPSFKGLTIWCVEDNLSTTDAQKSSTATEATSYFLYLPQDASKDDDEKIHGFVGGSTAFSQLLALFDATRSEFINTVAADIVNRDSVKSMGKDGFFRGAIGNPIEALRYLGGHISGERKISVLYRVRASSYDTFSYQPRHAAIIGYPLWITEATNWPAKAKQNLLRLAGFKPK